MSLWSAMVVSIFCRTTRTLFFIALGFKYFIRILYGFNSIFPFLHWIANGNS